MKKSSWLMAILMMDFSGSMDQLVDREPKQIILKESVSQYLESLPAKSKAEFIVFGINPKKGCRDFTQKALPPSEAKDWVQGLKPGVFGKTPLAEGIRRMGVLVRRDGHRNAMIITDGADTCGQDACQEIEKLDLLMKGLVAKLRLDIVGFDTQSDQQLQCLKDLKNKLSRIDLGLHDVGSRDQLMRALIQNQSHEKPKPGMAVVQVQGAPTDAKFILSPSQQDKVGAAKSWLGEFKVQIEPTRYKIKTNQTDAHEISFEVFAGDVRSIPYGDFFDKKNGRVNLTVEGLQLSFSPNEETTKAHPTAQSVTVERNQSLDLLFGKWTLTVTGPWWLNGVVKSEIKIDRNSVKDLSAVELFKEELDWEDSSKLASPGVLQIDTQKILVMPGTNHVPYKKGWHREWLTK